MRLVIKVKAPKPGPREEFQLENFGLTYQRNFVYGLPEDFEAIRLSEPEKDFYLKNIVEKVRRGLYTI